MATSHPSYRAVLSTPGIARAFIPSIIGRLSLATSGLALVLLLEESTGSFAVAGAATAAVGAANVIATPWRSRLIDRYGQPLMLSILGLMHALSLIMLAFAAGSSLLLTLAVSIVVGVSSPPFGATMRVVWSGALPAGPMLRRGFSLDALAEEVTFAVGPMASAILVALSGPWAALVLSAVCVAAGSAFFVTSSLSQRQRGARVTPADAPTQVSPLRSPGFVLVVAAMTAPGLLLGAIELAAPAIAIDSAAPIMSGVLLAVFASASGFGGLIFGGARLPGTHASQFVVLLGILVIVAGLTGVIGGPAVSIVGFALGGFCVAPMLIIGYLAADTLTHQSVRTEASSWINTAVNLGASVGAIVFGVMADISTTSWALASTAFIAAVIGSCVAPALLRTRGLSGGA